jgi:hypothetical protein
MIDGEETSLDARERWNNKRAVVADALMIEHNYGVMLGSHGGIGLGFKLLNQKLAHNLH